MSDERPHEFDSAVISWLPFLYKIAPRYIGDKQDVDDLVNETVAAALWRWKNYQPRLKISTWLAWQMRSSAQGMRRQRSVATIADSDAYERSPELPRQDDIVEITQSLRIVPERNRSVMMRHIMGASTAEIARQDGVTKQRIHQRITESRSILSAAWSKADDRD